MTKIGSFYCDCIRIAIETYLNILKTTERWFLKTEEGNWVILSCVSVYEGALST